MKKNAELKEIIEIIIDPLRYIVIVLMNEALHLGIM